jgi:hypothetical protein
VAAAPASAATWTDSLVRLEKLGMVAFQAQQLPSGNWRFICQLPTAVPGRKQRIETGPAATKAEAIQLAVVEAERLLVRP